MAPSLRYDLGLVTRMVEVIDHGATGARMKEARESAGVNLSQMAELLNTSPAFVDAYERGNLMWTQENVDAWAKALA